MDDAPAERFARELADAIAAVVAEDVRVAACRERARAAGFELRVTLDAVVTLVKALGAATSPDVPFATTKVTALSPSASHGWPADMTPADRRFLKSLRIAADEGLGTAR
jgi:hypothetical protein